MCEACLHMVLVYSKDYYDTHNHNIIHLGQIQLLMSGHRSTLAALQQRKGEQHIVANMLRLLHATIVTEPIYE